MLLVRRVAAICALVCLSAPASAAERSARLSVPDDTVVSIQLAQPVTSADNHVGDVFDVRVTDAVSAGGYVVVASNAKGRGHVTKIDEAGGHGHPGMVEVALDYVYAVDGYKLKLKDIPIRQEGEKAHGGATVAGIFTYGLASNAIKGGTATLGTARTLEAHVEGTVHVTSSMKSDGPNADAGFAH